MARLRLPGLIDVHVHLREPGGEHKEDISTGTAAAIAGGVTMVLAMPNTYPSLIDAQALARQRRLVEDRARCDVGLYVGATRDNAQGAAALAQKVVGLKIYLDQTYGPLKMRDLAALLTHFQAWPPGRPIAVHAEGLSAAMAIGLARVYGRRLHLCHVSLAEEIALIRAARESGVALTCEVAPHHLFLTQDDAERLGTFGAMKPPLGSRADTMALWTNLDVIDCIATDHAPHTRAEKEGDSPPPGVPGLEVMLPLLLTAVAEDRLGLERLVELTHHGPRRIFGLSAQPDTWVEVDTEERYILDQAELHTKCGWSPFEGMKLKGRVQRVVLRGETVCEAGQVQVEPGFGRVIEPVG
jgi:carbamoyl-phosphate synthase/aspartate carbamoyltransferase/dihydroorotase